MKSVFTYSKPIFRNEFPIIKSIKNKIYTNGNSPHYTRPTTIIDPTIDLLYIKRNILNVKGISTQNIRFHKNIIYKENEIEYNLQKWDYYISFYSWCYNTLVCKHASNKYFQLKEKERIPYTRYNNTLKNLSIETKQLEVYEIQSSIQILYNIPDTFYNVYLVTKSDKTIPHGKYYYTYYLDWIIKSETNEFVGTLNQKITLNEYE